MCIYFETHTLRHLSSLGKVAFITECSAFGSWSLGVGVQVFETSGVGVSRQIKAIENADLPSLLMLLGGWAAVFGERGAGVTSLDFTGMCFKTCTRC